MLSSRLQILLVVLKYSRLIIFAEIIGEHISVHQCTPALAENVQTFLEELHLNPGHVVLLHFLHLVLHHGVQLAFELERLEMIHVPVAIEEIPLQGAPTLLLVIPVDPGLVLVIPVTIVPGACVWLPGSQTHPAEVGLARLILANHVIASSVLLYGSPTLWALLGIGRYPVARLTVVVTLLDPFFDQVASHRVVPVLRAAEAEDMAASALDRSRLHVLNFDSIAAVWAGAPSQ